MAPAAEFPGRSHQPLDLAGRWDLNLVARWNQKRKNPRGVTFPPGRQARGAWQLERDVVLAQLLKYQQYFA
jgi:hypothetical protein